MFYRGYILIRISIIGKDEELVELLKNVKSTNPNESWQINYATPTYGGWDLIAECAFSKLSDLDKIVSLIRKNTKISSLINETTTLVGTKPNYRL